jgi:hypothetical protein
MPRKRPRTAAAKKKAVRLKKARRLKKRNLKTTSINY